MAATKAKKRNFEIEDLCRFRVINHLDLSPDGSRIVYTVETVSDDGRQYYSHLYVVDCRSGESIRFTSGKVYDSDPVWSPDGKQIAFISTRDKKSGLYIIAADGGAERKVIEDDGAFHSLNWTPDGRYLIYNFRYNDSHYAENDAEKGKAPLYRHITRAGYCEDGAGFVTKDKWQVWKLDIEKGRAGRLTGGRRDNLFPAVSPDGKGVAYVSNRDRYPDRNVLSYDLFRIALGGGKEKKIPTPPGPVFLPRYSPDGKEIAYIGHDRPDTGWGETPFHPWIVGSDGRREAVDLTPGFARSLMQMTLTDIGAPPMMSHARWSGDGKKLFFAADDTGTTNVYYVKSEGGEPVRVTEKQNHVKSFGLGQGGKFVGAVVADWTNPGSIHVFPGRRGGDNETRCLVFPDKSLLSEIKPPRTREVWFKGYDGFPLQGWLVTPPGFRKDKKYPGILQIHGGPGCQFGFTFFHEILVMASRGYVVFYTNPRGGAGRGKDFISAIHGAWGTVDYEDCMSAANYLEELPYVDKDRLGVTGGSYGGYMTNWIVAHNHRFRAAVTQRSLSNLATHVGSSCHGFPMNRTMGDFPWNEPELYRKCSPLTYARNIRTPLLIIHSEQDLNAKMEQSQQLFTTLKVLKKKVDMVLFPEESHGLSRHGRPDRRIARLEWIFKWFDKYLK